MAKVFGELGAEKALIEDLRSKGVSSLNGLADVERFLNFSDTMVETARVEETTRVRQEIDDEKSKHGQTVNDLEKSREDRRIRLTEERDSLRDEAKSDQPRNAIAAFIHKAKVWVHSFRLRSLEEHFEKHVERPFKKAQAKANKLKEAIEARESKFDEEVERRLTPRIKEKEKIDAAIEEAGRLLVGARGEQIVADALNELPDTFFVLHDVNLRLKPPLKTKRGPRYRCQADHVVVGPSGVFNVETKYWSQRSIENLDLRSPIEQIKLTGKALWREINNSIKRRKVRVKRHHWGDKNVQVRNVLAMAGAMPKTDFQYVKMLKVNQLKSYMEYFESCLENDEVENIAALIDSRNG